MLFIVKRKIYKMTDMTRIGKANRIICIFFSPYEGRLTYPHLFPCHSYWPVSPINAHKKAQFPFSFFLFRARAIILRFVPTEILLISLLFVNDNSRLRICTRNIAWIGLMRVCGLQEERDAKINTVWRNK